MPKCEECGNREAFLRTFDGEEIQIFDISTGDLDDICDQELETKTYECLQCESEQISW